MEFASFPKAKGHVDADAMGIKTRQDSLKRIAAGAQGYWRDSQWTYADLVSDIGVAPSAIFRRIGMRKYPLYVKPESARDLFGFWEIVCTCRIEFNHWELAP